MDLIDELMTVIGLALLPALGNFCGGLAAEWLRPSKIWLNRALHAAAGIVLAVVAVEVMPTALDGAPAWVLAGAFLAGGGAYLLLEAGISYWQRAKTAGVGTGAWMVYVAVASDLVGDGLLIGAGSAVSGRLALVLALGQVLADIPEGFAVIANFRDKGMSRTRRLAMSASFVIPVVFAALVAFLVLRQQDSWIKMAALAAVAGLYFLAALEDMLGEAHASAEDTRWSAASLIGGFALFMLVSDIVDAE